MICQSARQPPVLTLQPGRKTSQRRRRRRRGIRLPGKIKPRVGRVLVGGVVGGVQEVVREEGRWWRDREGIGWVVALGWRRG